MFSKDWSHSSLHSLPFLSYSEFGSTPHEKKVNDFSAFKQKNLILTFRVRILVWEKLGYRKFAIDRPGGMQFLATHNFWTTHLRTMIWLYSEKMQTFISEYIYMIILRCVVQKLCVDKNCIPPGLSIANLRYPNFILRMLSLTKDTKFC